MMTTLDLTSGQKLTVRLAENALRLRPGLGCVHFSVELEVAVSATTGLGSFVHSVTLAPTAVFVSFGETPLELDCAASPTLPENPRYGRSGAQYRLEYRFSLSRDQLSRLEDLRDGGPVRVGLSPVLVICQHNNHASAVRQTQILWTTVDAHSWGEQLSQLPPGTMDPLVSLVFAVGSSDPAFVAALGYLTDAGTARADGRHAHCVALCRKVIEAIEDALPRVRKDELTTGSVEYKDMPMREAARLLSTSVFKYACGEVHHGPDTGSADRLSSGTALAGATAAVFAALKYGL